MIKSLLLGFGGLVLAAATWIVLLPDAKQTRARTKPPATAVLATASPEQQTALHPVRVVYPGPDTSDARIKLAERVVPGLPIPQAVAPPAVSSTIVAQTAPPEASMTEAAAVNTPTTASPDVPVPAATAGQTININNASIEDMDHLAGAGRIGLAIARHRPYRSVEDLLSKRVVRKSVYEKIRMQLAAE